MTAARTGVAAVVTLLVEHGADVNAQENWLGETALMWAAAENNAAAVKVLLEHGAKPDIASNVHDLQAEGGRPDHSAARRVHGPHVCGARERGRRGPNARRRRRRSEPGRSGRIDGADPGDHQRALRPRRSAGRKGRRSRSRRFDRHDAVVCRGGHEHAGVHARPADVAAFRRVEPASISSSCCSRAARSRTSR